MKTRNVFTVAHIMTRATVREYPAADYRVTFAAALRECYADLRDAWNETRAKLAPAAAAVEDAPAPVESPRAAWDAMSGESQFDALVRMVWHMKKRDSAGCTRRGEERAPRLAWIVSQDDAIACANEAWTRMDALLTREETENADEPRPLALVMSRAVYRAAQYIDRAEKRHANALRVDVVTDKDGNETLREYIDTRATTAERIAPSPYEYAALSDAINAACADAVDVAIMKCKIYGLNQTETAAIVGMSQRAVSKRLEKITARYYADKLNNA